MARPFAKAFYDSREWAATRAYILKRDMYTCQRCGRPAQEVHHKEHLNERNIFDVNITMNPDNLVALCRDCHFKQHEEDKANGIRKNRKSDAGEGFHFDENGMLVKDVDVKAIETS